MKLLTSLIFIVASIGLFFWYMEPAWAAIGQTQSQINQFQNNITESTQAKTKYDQLISTYNSLNHQNVQQIENFLPASVSPTEFALSLNTIAAQYGSGLSGIVINQSENLPGQSFSVLPVTFSVKMSYSNFLLFLKDLERSLPLTDVTSLSFTPPVIGTNYMFSVSVQTYYLQ